MPFQRNHLISQVFTQFLGMVLPSHLPGIEFSAVKYIMKSEISNKLLQIKYKHKYNDNNNETKFQILVNPYSDKCSTISYIRNMFMVTSF